MHTTVLLGTWKCNQSAWQMASNQRFLSSLDREKPWEKSEGLALPRLEQRGTQQWSLNDIPKQKKNESSNEKHTQRSRFSPAMPRTSFPGHNCANGLYLVPLHILQAHEIELKLNQTLWETKRSTRSEFTSHRSLEFLMSGTNYITTAVSASLWLFWPFLVYLTVYLSNCDLGHSPSKSIKVYKTRDHGWELRTWVGVSRPMWVDLPMAGLTPHWPLHVAEHQYWVHWAGWDG